MSVTPGLANGRWPVEHCADRDCQAPIVWAITTNAKRMPVDAQPAAAGNIELRDAGGPVPVAATLTPRLAFGRTDLRTSHFATCPSAPSFRRRRSS